MADASRYLDTPDLTVTLAAAASAAQLRQLADGRVGWMQNLSTAGAIGDRRIFATGDQVSIPKTTGICFLDGGRAYWDRSARAGHYKQVDDQDCYIGTCVGDAASADSTMIVNLNIAQQHKMNLVTMPFSTAIVGTQALGGLALNRRGGALNFVLNATNEAQKLDALSKDGFGINANSIVEFAFNIISDGSGTVVDVSLGVANATHATDADSITNHLFLHLDANATAIKLQSKSTGKSTVTATDTTTVYVEGAGNANRVEGWMDFRNPADVQVYVNGVNVLPASVFDLSGATTLYLLSHIEKTASTDTYEFDAEWMFARTAEQ